MAFNPMDLTGHCVLVTGASSGLGRAAAVLMSRLGARLLLLGRDAERLRQTQDALEGEGHGILAFDLNDVEGIVPMVAEQAARFAPFSGLVHAAGITQTRPLQVCRPEDFESIYRVNVVAASQLLRGLTKPRAIASAGCSAVIVGSDVSLLGLPGLSSYACSKTAVLGLVRCAALELARLRIRVNAVLPGHFGGDSEMDRDFQKRLSAENVRKIEELYPLGFGRSEDVANAVAFLVADTARWITGSSLVVDGGRTAH
jgi:NAD(P)-dependent dehydrogenase (short-subunit alcohol dehydrogenase family)